MTLTPRLLSSDAERAFYESRGELTTPVTYLSFEHENPELVCTTQQLVFYMKMGCEILAIHEVMEYSTNKEAFKPFVDTLEQQRIDAGNHSCTEC